MRNSRAIAPGRFQSLGTFPQPHRIYPHDKTALCLAACALLALTGCKSRQHTIAIAFTSDPDLAAQTLTLTCRASSSGTCHFAFTYGFDPAEAAVKTGDSATLHGDLSNALYCAEVTRPNIATCNKSSIAPKRQTTSRSTRSDESE